MTFDSFVEGPVLWFSFMFFAAGVIVRLALAVYSVTRNRAGKTAEGRHVPAVFPRILLPLSSVARERPIYFSIRVLFHISVLVVPVWYSGHIMLWEYSDLELSWTPIPDTVADVMTIGIIVAIGYFMMRRIVDPFLRSISTFSDYLLFAVTLAPFLTGYLLAHGTVAEVTFIGDHMEIIHILSGEIMLIVIAVLFWRVHLNSDRCIGCAACELSCPTGALRYTDIEGERIFTHYNFPCIACGACVESCQEDAVKLGHALDVSTIGKLFSGKAVGQVALQVCSGCHKFYAPEPQIQKIFDGPPPEYGSLCPKCRMSGYKNKLVLRSRTMLPFNRENMRRESPG